MKWPWTKEQQDPRIATLEAALAESNATQELLAAENAHLQQQLRQLRIQTDALEKFSRNNLSNEAKKIMHGYRKKRELEPPCSKCAGVGRRSVSGTSRYLFFCDDYNHRVSGSDGYCPKWRLC